MVKFCLIFSIAFLFVCQNSFAQTNRLFVEFNSGMSFMNNVPLNTLINMPIGYNEKHRTVTHRPSANFNFLLGYQINNKIAVKTGIGYQNRVFDIGPVTNFISGGLPNKVSLRFITIPLNFEYAFYRDKKIQLFAEGGVSLRMRTHRDENKQLYGLEANQVPKETNGLNVIKSRNTAMLYGYNSWSQQLSTVPDSFVHIQAVFYELADVEWFTHLGTGLNVNLTERLAFTYALNYNFQLRKNSSFGKYSYTESYTNGVLFGKGEQEERSPLFRDNFFTMSAGFIYKF
jgi:hypothetical protein